MPVLFVLDTDTAVDFLRGDLRVRHRLLTSQPGTVGLPFMAAAELYAGAYGGNRVEENLRIVEGFLSEVPLLEATRDCLRLFGRLKAKLRSQGKLIEDADLLMAAVALSLGAKLVTRNRKHFARLDELELEDWTTSLDSDPRHGA